LRMRKANEPQTALDARWTKDHGIYINPGLSILS
jgi:hypothetical protein